MAEEGEYSVRRQNKRDGPSFVSVSKSTKQSL